MDSRSFHRPFLRRRARCALGVPIAVALLAGPVAASAQGVRLGARVGTQAVRLDRDSVGTVTDPGRAVVWPLLEWTEVRSGLAWSEVDLAAGVVGIPVKAIVVRMDPLRFDLALELATAANRLTGVWTVDSASAEAALAFNAGQFRETGPWGWVVLDGRERRDPGRGPLSVGLAVGAGGGLRWLPPEALESARDDPTVRWAFQSYPALWMDGRVPPLSRNPDLVDLDHRDARLILAERSDGTILVVLTRLDVLGPAAERVPVGLTLPESQVLMEALGVRHAVMLDGGASAQLLLRGPAVGTRVWRGSRRVPLALIARPRPD